ncbi:MAG: hypothetical protein MRERV_75c006 [Mycoplasmataceae bacterium RV_VA103A]|nr:MAG: hypothetical protein MRERV_75c006 [Mycoplasmataceae bacterium RV_VA103A]
MAKTKEKRQKNTAHAKNYALIIFAKRQVDLWRAKVQVKKHALIIFNA